LIDDTENLAHGISEYRKCEIGDAGVAVENRARLWKAVGACRGRLRPSG
jgi:hypothetical protein